MILGGSWISCGDEASVWARFHFRPHFFQHAGFRVVQAAHDGGVVKLGAADAGRQVYEDARIVDDYMLLHHGEPPPRCPGPAAPVRHRLPQRCAHWLLDGARQYGSGTARALDIGCAVGGASFELARGFGEVLGVDLSRAFIDAAKRCRRTAAPLLPPRRRRPRPDRRRPHRPGHRPQPGELPPGRRLFAARPSWPTSTPCCWPTCCAACPAPSPCSAASAAARAGQGGRPGGPVLALLVAGAIHPREAWLGGFEKDGQPVKSADALKAFLRDEGFVLRREEEVPLVIREHARKYQFIVTHGMLWQRER
jgi:SAM-dependent methyltransferase